MANMKDVAKLAKVSITTVSHVINQTRYVSDELSTRVKQAMEELEYYPNSLASSLRSGKTKIIGLVIPDISNQFFAEVSRKIEDNGYEYGYSVILCNTSENVNKEETYIDVLIAKQVDGIIFISAGEEINTIKKTIDSNIPIVIVDRDVNKVKADVILVDNYDGGYKATQYLLGLGHRRIGCITGPSPVSPSALRIGGYKQALKDAGISVDEDLIVPGDFRYESGRIAMEKLLSLSDMPTAVFACNDMMAIGAIQAAYDNDLVIPDDISIVGFDNIPLSNSVYPPLTTVAQPFDKLAKLTVDSLIEKIKLQSKRRTPEQEAPWYERTVMEIELVERSSCRPLSEDNKALTEGYPERATQ